MALPYPLEVETGALDGPPRRRLHSLPLDRRIAEAVRCQGNRAFAFGKELTTAPGFTAQEACADLRRSIRRRMEERLPFADEEQWAKVARLMSDQIDEGDEPDRVIRTAELTIDTL